ncbi:hypothetical protein ACJW31_06G203600 [Castanea mollissima]
MGINSDSVPDICKTKDFYSHLIHHIIKPDQVLRGRITCLLTVNPALSNIYGNFHGGAVAAVAEKVSYACARTVLAENKDIFLGELSISYLYFTEDNSRLKSSYANLLPMMYIAFERFVAYAYTCLMMTEVIVDCSVVRSGRNLTVVAMEFKVKKTGKLAYTARSTFFNMPVAKL